MNLNRLLNLLARQLARRVMLGGRTPAGTAGRKGSNRQTQDLSRRMRMLARLIRR